MHVGMYVHAPADAALPSSSSQGTCTFEGRKEGEGRGTIHIGRLQRTSSKRLREFQTVHFTGGYTKGLQKAKISFHADVICKMPPVRAGRGAQFICIPLLLLGLPLLLHGGQRSPRSQRPTKKTSRQAGGGTHSGLPQPTFKILCKIGLFRGPL